MKKKPWLHRKWDYNNYSTVYRKDGQYETMVSMNKHRNASTMNSTVSS